MIDDDLDAKIAEPPPRPKRVTVDVDLFESVMSLLDQLPHGQVSQLYSALAGDVRPCDD